MNLDGSLPDNLVEQRSKQPSKKYPTCNGKCATKLCFAFLNNFLILQPMPGGEANIQTTNPPPNLEPRIPTISDLHEPHEYTKRKPGQQQDGRGLQEQGLRLREPLDRIEREYGLGEAYGVVIHAAVDGDGGVGREQSAGVGGDVQEAPRQACAERAVVANRVRWARHGRVFAGTQIEEEQSEGEGVAKFAALGQGTWIGAKKKRNLAFVSNERMSARVKGRNTVLGWVE